VKRLLSAAYDGKELTSTFVCRGGEEEMDQWKT